MATLNQLPKSSRYILLLLASIAVFIVGIGIYGVSSQQSTPETPQICANVRYMIDEGITPYDHQIDGGILSANRETSRTVSSGQFADVWILPINRVTDTVGNLPNADLTLSFETSQDDTLEFALFSGMSIVQADNGFADYRPISTGDVSYTLRETMGIYTLVIRRINISNQADISYSVTSQINPGAEGVEPTSSILRDTTTNSALPEATRREAGYAQITLPSTQLRAHFRALTGVAGFNGNGALATYESSYNLRAERWVDDIALIGGDLALSGASDEGIQRQFYLQDFDFRDVVEVEEALTLIDNNAHTIRLNWEFITGVWITRDCAGFRVQHEGETYTFIGTIDPNDRRITFQGTFDDFLLRLQMLDTSNATSQHQVTMTWAGVAPESTTQYLNGTFQISMLGETFGAEDAGERELSIEATHIDLRPDRSSDDRLQSPLSIQISEIDNPDEAPINIQLDWEDLHKLAITNEMVLFTFLDNDDDQNDPRETARQNRPRLQSITALEDVINIIYAPTLRGELGEQILMLSDQHGFIEIHTPAGLPTFDAHSLPNQPNYQPRALNNTGGECYPINTLLPEANCPPNGHVNPANGNLWYAVTDHIAYGNIPMGDPFNLSLTRSYNSARADIDGAFGYGWSSEYLLDYDVPFDVTTSSRQITLDNAHEFPVGLNVIYAPRGYVTFITPSGSQHIFVSDNSNYIAGELNALTMPNWTLNRTHIGGDWILTQDDGLTYYFDPAGRLIRYGYVDDDRLIEVHYPRDEWRTPDALSDIPVIIRESGDTPSRQLELYYDNDGHITTSILRDLTTYASVDDIDYTDCDNAIQNCFITRYSYDEGHLTQVDYPDGTSAHYRYDLDGSHHLISHNDPRAPISPVMTYTYTIEDFGCENGCMETATIVTSEGDQSWQSLAVIAPVEDINPALLRERQVTVTDSLGNPQTYTYVYNSAENNLRTAGNAFTLIEVSSPLFVDDVNQYEFQPFRYEWLNGLLNREDVRQTRNGDGRNSTLYGYTPAGDNITSIDIAYPTFSAIYGANGIEAVNFADGTRQQYIYSPVDDDESNTIGGQLATFTDRHGAVYHYRYQEDAVIIGRENDGMTTRYEFNTLGLITKTQRYIATDSSAPYTVIYDYDGLGRLTQVDDPLTGTYNLSYEVLPDSSEITLEIRLTDATGAITYSRFNSRGKLQETLILPNAEADESDYLRRTTYAYDYQDRITEVINWLAPLTVDETVEHRITQYAYTNINQLPAVNGGLPTLIGGYQISEYNVSTDEDDILHIRINDYIYDVYGRIRHVTDQFGRVTRYEYTPLVAPDNGLLISEYQVDNGIFTLNAEYRFNAQWQLETVQQDDFTWDLDYRFSTFNLETLDLSMPGQNAFRDTLITQNWSPFNAGNPSSIATQHTSIDANHTSRDGINLQSFTPNVGMEINYDFLGRPLQAVDGTNTIHEHRYCPLADGGERVLTLYPTPNIFESSTTTDCSWRDIVEAITYDAMGRVTQIQDAHGARTYTYNFASGDGTGGTWEVIVDFNSPNTETIYQWRLTYNSVGELLSWIDESGVLHTYQHDSLGHLRRIIIEDQPEASFTFTYTSRGLLTERIDDIGRGTRYAYDEHGQLSVEQDIRTGNATIYDYNNNGQLTTVISPLGNTTTYRYEDSANPDRLTSIIGATGNITHFSSNEGHPNQLIVTDPRGNQTTYTYDLYGALWRIDDALPDRDSQDEIIPPTATSRSTSELIYDEAGNLVAWEQYQLTTNQGTQVTPIQQLRITQPLPYTLNITPADSTIDWERELRFNPFGQLIDIASPNTASLNFDYDALGRLNHVEAEGLIWALNYATGASQVTFTDSNGQLRMLSYDALNRLTQLNTSDESQSLTYAYESQRNGEVNLAINADDSSVIDNRIITYSSSTDISNPTSVTLRAVGQRRTYLYSPSGLLTEIRHEVCTDLSSINPLDTETLPDDCIRTNPSQVWRTSERFIYDALGRPTRYIDQNDNIAVFAYDDAGNLVNYQDISGQTFNYTYDEINRLSSIIDPTGTRLLLRYDGLGNVRDLCRIRADMTITFQTCLDTNGLLEGYTYDSLSRLVSQTFPNEDATGTINYEYNSGTGLLSAWGIDESRQIRLIQSTDGLDRLTQMEIANNETSTTYNVTYTTSTQLASITDLSGNGDLAYTYDAYGRLATLSTSGRELVYSYNESQQGYSITDVASDSTIHFRLDERGLLSEIDYNRNEANTDSPLISLDYVRNPNGRILIAQIMWNDGELIEVQLNRQGDTRSITYSQPTLFIDYVTDGAGRVQRRNITGASQFFVQGNGYITLIGYDNNGRPLTMRVTERSSGDLLYLLSITYDADGQREVETYQNLLTGGQIIINSNYTSSQLRSQTFTIDGIRTEQVYHYTPAGNLASIATVSPNPDSSDVPLESICTQFTYDGANRLIRYESFNQNGIVELSQNFEYDLRNRLIQAGNRTFVYNGDSQSLIATYDSQSSPTMYAQTTNLPSLFYVQADTIEWLVNDGNDSILTTLSNQTDTVNNNISEIWVFDPFGRTLPLEVSASTSNDCITFNQIADIPYPQVLHQDMIWDEATNLYFNNGRVYAPQIGRYLQRDPLGSDVFGNIYSFPSRQANPLVRVRPPAYIEGLETLHNALSNIAEIRQYTADNIIRDYYPNLDIIAIDPLYQQFEATTDITRRHLTQQLALPVWLSNQYNLPSAYIDATGRLRLPIDNAPAQGGLSDSLLSPYQPDMLFENHQTLLWDIPTPLARLMNMIQRPYATNPQFNSYIADAWRPESINLASTWHVAIPILRIEDTPSAIWAWLPQPLDTPSSAYNSLAMVEMILELPTRTGQSWVDLGLELAMPTSPELPISTSDEWLMLWFSDDTLGIADILQARHPQLPSTHPTLYSIGDTPTWVEPE